VKHILCAAYFSHKPFLSYMKYLYKRRWRCQNCYISCTEWCRSHL